jgi:hypothetical protein
LKEEVPELVTAMAELLASAISMANTIAVICCINLTGILQLQVSIILAIPSSCATGLSAYLLGDNASFGWYFILLSRLVYYFYDMNFSLFMLV